MREIYLDNSATTKICPFALQKYIEVSEGNFGNPSSRHLLGKQAEEELMKVRSLVMKSIFAKEGTVIFTSNGTEANNLAVLGRALSKDRFQKNGKIITTQGEHASISEPLLALQKKGFTIVGIPTTGGKLDLEVLERELNEQTVLVTMMLVNNETGALYDLARVANMMKSKCKEAILHIDATQAYFKVPIDVNKLGCDMMTLSSHKIEGPKGIGALWVSSKVLKEKGLSARELGGGQESGFRSGTENVPGIAAFGAAIQYKMENFSEQSKHLNMLHDYLCERIEREESLREVHLNIPESHAPSIVSITLPKIKSETMLHFLSEKGIYVSSGSACSSHNAHLSSAMLSFGLSEKEADCTIRVSFGTQNTIEDIEDFVTALKEGVARLIRIR